MGGRFAGRACVRRDSSEGGRAFALRARGGVLRLHCSLRSVPLPLVGFWAHGEGLEVVVGLFGFLGFLGDGGGGVVGGRFAGRACVRRDSSEGGRAFALRARGGLLRLHCSQRPVPLPLGDVRGDVADFWGQAGLWMDCGLGTGWFGSVGVAPRDRSCARREARGRYGFFALGAKGGG